MSFLIWIRKQYIKALVIFLFMVLGGVALPVFAQTCEPRAPITPQCSTFNCRLGSQSDCTAVAVPPASLGARDCCEWRQPSPLQPPQQKSTQRPTVSLQNPIGETNIVTIIGKVLNAALGLLGSVAFVVFLYGGFLWLTSAGSEEKVYGGLHAMMYAAIGIFIVFGSYAMLRLLFSGLTGSAAGISSSDSRGASVVPARDDTPPSNPFTAPAAGRRPVTSQFTDYSCRCAVRVNGPICTVNLNDIEFLLGQSVSFDDIFAIAEQRGQGCSTARALIPASVSNQRIEITEASCPTIQQSGSQSFHDYSVSCRLVE